jgi:hypothetical protein
MAMSALLLAEFNIQNQKILVDLAALLGGSFLTQLIAKHCPCCEAVQPGGMLAFP